MNINPTNKKRRIYIDIDNRQNTQIIVSNICFEMRAKYQKGKKMNSTSTKK